MSIQEIYINYRFSFELECSNRNIYEYTQEQVSKMLSSIREALNKQNLSYHKLKIKKKIYKW